jgi:hypothetical protein
LPGVHYIKLGQPLPHQHAQNIIAGHLPQLDQQIPRMNRDKLSRKPSTVWILWAAMPFLRTTSSSMAVTHEAIPGLSQAHANEVTCDESTPLSALAFLDLDSNSEQIHQFDDHQKIGNPHSMRNPATGQGSSPLAFFQNHYQLSYDQNRSQLWPSVSVQSHDLLAPSRSLDDEYKYGQCDHLEWPGGIDSEKKTKQTTTTDVSLIETIYEFPRSRLGQLMHNNLKTET